MRIPSGKTDQRVYFVAVDATDGETPLTGLNTFIVYRSRNGGTAVAMTTPDVVEISSANMPGLYALLLDEDTTIDVGSDSEEMALHITHATMKALTGSVELYRPAPTASDNADAVLDRADGVETGLTLRQWLRLAASVLFGKASGLGTTTAVFRDYNDNKARITATVDADGNRSAITRDAT